jgi:hypothetical protein
MILWWFHNWWENVFQSNTVESTLLQIL